MKVNVLLQDGLALDGDKVTAAKRLPTKGVAPGIVIATCASIEDKHAILRCKRKLASSQVYKNTYIDTEKSRNERVQESNMREIVKTLSNGKLKVVGGGRVVKTNEVRGSRPNNKR